MKSKRTIKGQIQECKKRIDELVTEGAYRDTDDQIRFFEEQVKRLEEELKELENDDFEP